MILITGPSTIRDRCAGPNSARVGEAIAIIQTLMKSISERKPRMTSAKRAEGMRSSDTGKSAGIGAGCRATYLDLFEHANRHAVGCRVVIANADIYFDETLASLTRRGS
jgi:hypothetical protein